MLATKINELENKKKQLEKQKQDLIEKRKYEIGKYFHEQKLIAINDELLIGTIAYLKNIIQDKNKDKMEELKKLASPFLKKTKTRKPKN